MTVVAVTDTAVPDETLERELAAEAGAEYRSCADGVDIAACLTGANLVFTNFAPLGPAELALVAPDAVIVRYGVGVDNIDLAAAAAAGLRVANVPDYGMNVVADHAVMLIAAMVRRLLPFDRAMHDGQQPAADALGPIHSMDTLTVGLLGAGRIAQLTAGRLRAFGCAVVATDPYVSEIDVDGVSMVDHGTLIRTSDVVSLHAPLTDETHHVLDDAAFAAAKPGLLVVNTARGPLIDTDALVRALDAGTVAGAALDVTDPEPLPADHPLRGRDNVILTPHTAFYSDRSMERLQSLAVEEGRRALRGEQLRSPVRLPATETDATSQAGEAR